jgi:microcystin-dependent protein
MARIEVPIVVQNSEGQPVNGAAVQIKLRSNGANATWYTSEVAPTGSTAAVITDVYGRVNAWVDRGAYNAVITGTGITGYTEPFDALPATDQSLDYGILSASILDRFVPIGASLEWSGDGDPAGGMFMVEDGRAISRTTYATLYGVLAIKYGAGDGTTTFNIPDSRGRVVVGKGTHSENDVIGENDGLAVASRRLKHSHASGGLTYSHTHSITSDGSHSHTVNSHYHEHVFPVALTSGQITGLGPHGTILDSWSDSSVFQNDNGSYGVSAPYDADLSSIYAGGNTAITVERHIQRSTTSAPGTSSSGAHSHGGATGGPSGSFGGDTAESTPAFIVKNRIIRVL